jgi:hypothetical protein
MWAKKQIPTKFVKIKNANSIAAWVKEVCKLSMICECNLELNFACRQVLNIAHCFFAEENLWGSML